MKYDVVVIGAGLGGLSAACCLAQEGRKVLLVEQHNIPGGYATSFVRSRFEFEVALHLMAGPGPVENREMLLGYLDQLGVADRVEFALVRDFCRSITPGWDLTIPWDEEGFKQALCSLSPGESDGICSFVDLLLEVSALSEQAWAGINSMNPLGLASTVPGLARYLALSVQEVMDRYFSSSELTCAMTHATMFCYLLPPSRLSFFTFATAMGLFIKYGGCYPRGRSQQLSNVLLERFLELGGEVRFSTRVSRIRVSGARVSRVELDQGESIETRQVISNANPVTTMRELVDDPRASQAFLKALGPATPSPSAVSLYLGLDRAPGEVGLSAHETFLFDSLDPGHILEDMDRPEKLGRHLLITCYNHIVPEISPPGTTLMSLICAKQGLPWTRIDPEHYAGVKDNLARAILERTEQAFPGVTDAVEVAELGTPLTNMRYTGNFAGSVVGFDAGPSTHTVLRPSNTSPVEGLFFAGAWTRPGGGMQVALESGRWAARAAGASLSRTVLSLGKGLVRDLRGRF